MKTESEIRIDFEKAMKTAEQMKECGNSYKVLADKRISDCMKKLSGQWEGYAEVAYQRKVQELVDDMLKTARKLNTIGETLETEARRLYEAEMAAIAIAKTISNKRG